MVTVTGRMAKEMRRLRSAGVMFTRIARQLGVHPNTVRYHTDDGFQERQREAQRRRHRASRQADPGDNP